MSQDCFLNSKDFGSSRGLSGLVRLSECNDEVKHHLISCHLSKEVLSEMSYSWQGLAYFTSLRRINKKMWICV